MSARSRRAAWLAPLALAGLAGCAGAVHATAGFPGLANPVLLGPLDRVGQAPARPAPVVGPFKTQALFDIKTTETSIGNTTTVTTTWSKSGLRRLTDDARQELRDDPSLDIHVKTLHAEGWMYMWAGWRKAYVDLDGDIVKAAPPAGAAPRADGSPP